MGDLDSLNEMVGVVTMLMAKFRGGSRSTILKIWSETISKLEVVISKILKPLWDAELSSKSQVARKKILYIFFFWESESGTNS